MKAIIRFEDGTEATLRNGDGIWECANSDLKVILDVTTEMLPHEYYPDPIGDLARAVAAKLGAEVVYTDPLVEEGDVPPGTDF